MGFLGSLIVLAIFAFLLEKITNKLLGVEKRKISETPGKSIDRWGRGIILVILLCTLPFVFANDIYNTMWYWVFYVTIIWGFQAILEWKYIKNSKQYVTTIILLMFILSILYNIEYFF
ncbi:DUF4181 domain-containing protein [Lysinibacillus sp. NPDC096418]|uniref:DUF4181 domain-containing protein n=1 Tax=Lysinibacillus sp. NPDC096418 TaxID=3364138 RepID=UPI003812596A